MTFLSYAPNCEDVVLWRCLKDVGAGFYLDWDAFDPGTVTRALHARTWRGVSIVATHEQAVALAGARPDDHVVIASEDEPLTLAAVVQGVQVDEVHVVRLNVPGNQAPALSLTLPLSPWVVVVRAGDAQTDELLARSGYRPALYDGVNRFHVAPAHYDRLASRLLAPANVTDDFLRIGDLAVAKRLDGMGALVVAARQREAASRDRMLDAVRTVGVARTTMVEESKWIRGLLDEARTVERNLRAEVAWLRQVWDDSKGLAAHAQAEAERHRTLWEDSQRELSVLQHRVVTLNMWTARMLGHLTWLLRAVARRIRSRLRRWLRPVQRRHAPDAPDPVGVAAPTSAEPARGDAGMEPGVTPLIDDPALAGPGARLSTTPHQQASTVVVHQFHAGSAPGNAITNCMLLIRTVLRARGFRSDIYVEHRAAGLDAQDILLLDALPEHSDYVLLVHHSMGYPEFDRIIALPARKILIYHNITPPHYLSTTPRIEQMASLGRQQLATLRDHTVAALAVSDYNAMELHGLRFPVVRTCPLLFDVASLVKQGICDRLSDGVFTVLFVGRVTPSKGQDGLIEAFAHFRTILGRPSRLVLVGSLDVDEHPFLTRLDTLITGLDLQGHVQLTGLVSDAELRDWYRQADLYVSLSLHEGFCVPLVEAMAYGVPVLAWPSGAVAETLDDPRALLPSREPRAVAERMALAAGEGRSGLRHQAGLARFSLDRHVPTLLEVLAVAGAFPPAGQAAHEQMAANLHIAVAGHVGKSYSLAAVNRAIATTLERERPGTVRMIPVEGAPTNDLSEVPVDQQDLVRRLSARGEAVGYPELVLSQHYPVYVPPTPAAFKAALFFWEESLIPPATVATLNTRFDAVFAPSRFVARALVDSGVSQPVIMIGHAPALRYAEAADVSCKEGPFTFLHVSSGFPRKGVDVLLNAWREAFSRHDPVRLVLKTFPNPHNVTAAQLADLRASAEIAPVNLIDAEIAAADMRRLLGQADAMVLPSRGEGYNLPAAEAMAAGIALITTDRGGHMDFCSAGTTRLVATRLAPSGSHLATPHSLWAEPDVADLVAALREAFAAGRGGLADQRRAARSAIAQATSPADWTARLAAASAALLLGPPASAARIAWISTWGVGCGVAEYSRALLDAMPQANVTLLGDERAAAAPRVRVAWRLGDPENAERLARAVARVDADIVVIQHQPGLLDWPVLARLVTQLVGQGRGVVVTLHTTNHLVESPEPDRRLVVAALDRAARVLVHTLADVQALKEMGMANLAVLVPHAAPAATPAALRSLPSESAPIVGCTGFFLPGKGIGPLIQAVANLRERWPAIRLRLVNAEYEHPASAAEIAACRAVAEREGLAVDWHTSFLPLHAIGATLRGCDLLVLPYQHSNESSSAALRTALGTGIPVAVTPLPLFDEARQAVARLSSTDAASIAQGIAALLDDEPERRRLQQAARDWLDARAVSAVAQRLHGMIEGLAAQRRTGQPLDGDLWRSRVCGLREF